MLEDRARFSRAWFRQFNTYQSRGGSTEEEAYQAWLNEIIKRYPKHSFKLNLDEHPVFIRNKLSTIEEDQFGFDAFGLLNRTKFQKIYLLKGLREKYINPLIYLPLRNTYK